MGPVISKLTTIAVESQRLMRRSRGTHHDCKPQIGVLAWPLRELRQEKCCGSGAL